AGGPAVGGGGTLGAGVGARRGLRGGGSNPAGVPEREEPAGPRWGGGPGHSGGPAAAATLDASRALPVDRLSCGGRRGRSRGARRVPARVPSPRGLAPPPHRLSRGAWRGRAGVPRVWGEPPRRCSPAGSAPRAAVFRAAPRLGRRLAADLELVRTRGIRLFN
ncbi:hypothetical protein CKX37_26460, partial [Escherichia coli]